MFSVLRRNRLGIPGLISVIALVFAMGGGAYAANGDGAGASAKNRKGGGNVNKLIKRESQKFSKRFSRVFSKRFAPLFPGPIGPRGFPGLPGADGDDGDDGDDGSNGSNGVSAEGVSFSGGEEPAGNPCGGLGGVEVKSASPEPSYVCNGEEGSPWTELGTLPKEATLTGAWAMGTTFEEEKEKGPFDPQIVPISFPIPLEEGLDAAQVHYLDETGEEIVINPVTEEPEQVPPSDCGSALLPEGTPEDPRANPGHLCIYAGFESELGSFLGYPLIVKPGSSSFLDSGASSAGAALQFSFLELKARARGTWAVTAE